MAPLTSAMDTTDVTENDPSRSMLIEHETGNFMRSSPHGWHTPSRDAQSCLDHADPTLPSVDSGMPSPC